jgi:hypothetical protein
MESVRRGAAHKIDEIRTGLSYFRQNHLGSGMKIQLFCIFINWLHQQPVWHVYCGSRTIA